MAKAKSVDEAMAAVGKKKPPVKREEVVSGARVAPSPADPPEVKEASLSPRARKAAVVKQKEAAAAKKARPAKPARSAKPAMSPGAAAADAKRATLDLRADLRAFAAGRPQGWDHKDWLAFLEHLRERGHETSDADAIGKALERERLAVVLETVQGMGPRRVDALVERFQTLWSLRHAPVDAIASTPGMNLSLAEKVRQALAAG